MTQGTSRKRGMKDCKNENDQSLLEMTSKTRLEQYQYQWTFQQEREKFLGVPPTDKNYRQLSTSGRRTSLS